MKKKTKNKKNMKKKEKEKENNEEEEEEDEDERKRIMRWERFLLFCDSWCSSAGEDLMNTTPFN